MTTDTTFFCHDSHTLYYPQAPGRIYAIAWHALGDCDGSAADFTDSTEVVGGEAPIGEVRSLVPYDAGMDAPVISARLGFFVDERSPDDIADLVGAWADWCDRDSETVDALDAAPGHVAAPPAANTPTAA